MTWLILLRASMLDELGWSTSFIESWRSEKLPWVTTRGVHGFESFAAFEDYDELAKDFTARAGAKA